MNKQEWENYQAKDWTLTLVVRRRGGEFLRGHDIDKLMSVVESWAQENDCLLDQSAGLEE